MSNVTNFLNGKKKIGLASQNDLFKFVDKITTAQSQIDKGRDGLNSVLPMAEKALTEVEMQAKDLGINPDDIKGYKSLKIEVQNTKSSYL
jgi:hypothetical protein